MLLEAHILYKGINRSLYIYWKVKLWAKIIIQEIILLALVTIYNASWKVRKPKITENKSPEFKLFEKVDFYYIKKQKSNKTTNCTTFIKPAQVNRDQDQEKKLWYTSCYTQKNE